VVGGDEALNSGFSLHCRLIEELWLTSTANPCINLVNQLYYMVELGEFYKFANWSMD
jgi:hypothetical protein